MREREDTAVHREVERQGQRAGGRRCRSERLEQGPGEDHAGEAADQRQQHALGQELLQQPAAARSKREAHGQLAAASRRPGEQQVGDVGARDQQHRADHTAQQERRRAQLRPRAEVRVVHGPEGDARSHGPRRQLHPRPEEFRQHGIELGARALDRDVGLEAADAEDPAVGRVLEQIGILFAGVARPRRPRDRLHHHRHVDLPHASNLRSREPGRRHADDREDVPVQADLAPDHVGAAAEARLPEVVRDHHYWMRPRGDVVAWFQQASECRLHAEHLEEVAGGDDARHELCGVARVEARHDAAPAGQSVEGPGVVAQHRVLRVRENAAGAAIHVDQPLGVRDRQPLEERRVDQAEDRGVRADPEREGEDGGRREARLLPQHARGVAQVLQQVLDEAASRRAFDDRRRDP